MAVDETAQTPHKKKHVQLAIGKQQDQDKQPTY